jgi:pSer/pThr/pTyr-binding forkhead associated (FHA) protein
MSWGDTVYLVVDGGVVYEMAPNSTLRIGRSSVNDVMLDDYKVSREHALVKYAGNKIILIDQASTQGTIFNAEKINQATLDFNDSFQIVNHELQILETRPLIQDEGDGVWVEAKTQKGFDRRVKFFGGLNEFSLITLVQFLSQEKQSGLLILEEGGIQGPRLYFYEGEIIHVENDVNLSELLTRQIHATSLYFYFHHETEFPDRTIKISTPNYLMELCHKQDLKETSRLTFPPEMQKRIAGSSQTAHIPVAVVQPRVVAQPAAVDDNG